MGVTASLLGKHMFLSGMREETDISPKPLRKDAVETTQNYAVVSGNTQVRCHI